MGERCRTLYGRIALITGGGSGIGKEVCLLFASDGAKVIVCDIDPVAAEETLKQLSDSEKHLAKSVDVSNANSVNELISQVEKEVGAPDILVNCAGIKRNDSLVDMTEAAFDKVMDVNCKGTFLMTQAVVKLMIRHNVPNGSVVNVSSISANLGFHSNYSASKAGVEGLTKNTAREMGRYGIRCNAIKPGIIVTPLNADMTPEMLDDFKKMTPLGRNGRPEEIAEVCKFLASDKSSFITGALIQVSGGLYM